MCNNHTSSVAHMLIPFHPRQAIRERGLLSSENRGLTSGYVQPLPLPACVPRTAAAEQAPVHIHAPPAAVSVSGMRQYCVAVGL